MPDPRLVLVEAPVGFGKSTWAQRWLDGREAVPVRFVAVADTPPASRLARALRRAGLVAAAEAVAVAEAGDVFDTLVGALGADPADLVVDDAHLLAPTDAAALADALRDLPAGCAAVVCGRDLRAFAGLPAARVGTDELALDVAQIAAQLGEPADSVFVREVAAATEGWPAAVALAADRHRRDPTWTAGTAGVRTLLRALVDDLVAGDPRLVVLARLPAFDDEIAALLGAGSTTDLPARRSGRWRIVPTAVRDLCEQDAAGTPLGPEFVAAVARHYRRWGETSAALTLLRRHAGPAELTGFLAALPWTELEALGVAELRVVVDALGVPRTEEHALLLVHSARAVELTDRTLRSRWLAAARDAAPSGTPTARALAAELARETLRGADVEAGAAQARAVLAEASAEETVTRARALVTVAMRENFLGTPETLDAAARLFAEAAELYRVSGETELQADTLARMGYSALYLAGRPAEGAAAMAEALALLPASDRIRAHWLTSYADVLDFLGRVEEAEAVLREAIEIGTRRRDTMTLGMAWWSRSWLVAHRGDPAALRAALAQVERHRGAWLQGGQEAEYVGSSAERLSMAGDLAGYAEYLERTRVLAAELDYPTIADIPQAIHAAEHGDPARALELLDAIEAGPTAVPGERPRWWLFRALALLRLGRLDEARAAAQDAFAAAASMGVPDLHERYHRHQLGLLAPVLGRGPAPAAPRLRLLGRFALSVGADDRTPAPGHPATLVKMLALDRLLTVDVAVDRLWPDADPATGRARLRNTLNRLKERSGPVVVRDGDTLRLDDAVQVDAVLFDAAAGAALSAPPAERVGRARHAIALYTGDLLAGDLYEEWAVLDRERLRRRFVSLADLVAADCVERGELDEAARLYDLGIAAEPLDELRVVALCDALVRQGRPSQAREVARRCAAALDDVGVRPGPDLTAYLTG